ncbi:MAG TPA: LysR family transcriptional regulator, partial [Ramlibacter sp.]|nr:LysR family transcriptional regulator [Ramlibacter sp.]
MDLRKFDLNLLLVLDALLRDRSVTLAAQRLGLTQPTVSAALNRLRAAFQDDLFVKTSRGVEPTQLARELENVVAETLETVQSGILNRTAFEAATTERTFVVIVGELGQMVFVDRMLMRFRQVAPRAKIRFVFPDAHERLALLKDGRADLAMGYFPQFARTNLFQQLL